MLVRLNYEVINHNNSSVTIHSLIIELLNSEEHVFLSEITENQDVQECKISVISIYMMSVRSKYNDNKYCRKYTPINLYKIKLIFF